MMSFRWLVSCIGMCRKDKGGALSNHQAWGHLDGDTHPNWRTDIDDNPGSGCFGFVVFADVDLCLTSQCSSPDPGVFILNIKSYFNATWFLVLAMLYDACPHLRCMVIIPCLCCLRAYGN